MDNHPQVFGFVEMQSKTQKNLKFKIVEKTKEKGIKKHRKLPVPTCGPAYDLEGSRAYFKNNRPSWNCGEVGKRLIR